MQLKLLRILKVYKSRISHNAGCFSKYIIKDILEINTNGTENYNSQQNRMYPSKNYVIYNS